MQLLSATHGIQPENVQRIAAIRHLRKRRDLVRAGSLLYNSTLHSKSPLKNGGIWLNFKILADLKIYKTSKFGTNSHENFARENLAQIPQILSGNFG